MSKPRGLPKRIMIVDDSEIFSDFLKSRLEERGYEVATAATEEEAAQEIRSGAAQFFVLDLFLEGVEDKFHATSAYRLLNLLEEYVDIKKSWVGLSSADQNPAFLFWKKRYGQQVRPKFTDDSPVQTLDWIEQRFNESTPHNWNLEVECYVGPQKISLQHKSLEGKELDEAIEESLRLLIGKDTPFESIKVEPFYDQGYSSTLKLQVYPHFPKGTTGNPTWYLLKAGEKPDIFTEYTSYSRAVAPYSFRQRVGMKSPTQIRRYSLGALLYDFVRRADQLKRLYNECVSEEQLERLKMVVKKLFADMANAWFYNLRHERQFLRTKTFQDLDAEEIRRLADGMLKGLACARKGSIYTLKVGSQRKKLFIPLPFEECLKNPVGLWMPCTAHGDLHTGNVLVLAESDDSVLIDFSETQSNQPFLRDFAKFETHLVLDLLPEPPDLASIAGLVDWQIDAKSFIPSSAPPKAGDWPPDKGIQMISWVRQCMEEIIKTCIPANELNDQSWEQLLHSYHFLLWREHILAWRWMIESSALKRFHNLTTIARISSFYCDHHPDRKA